MTDYRKALETLRGGQVRFIVIGGVAATAHGSTQLTNDLDVVYARGADDIARLATALAPHNPYLRGVPAGLPFRFDAPTIKRGLNFTLDTDSARLIFWVKRPAAERTKRSCPTRYRSIFMVALASASTFRL
jgi:hypothetical protein